MFSFVSKIMQKLLKLESLFLALAKKSIADDD
jgi:hypothetical protein